MKESKSMQRFIDLYKKTKFFHHAYVFEGEISLVLKALIDFFEHDAGIYTRGNPDFHIREYDSFGIDDSRDIQNLALQKPLSGDKKFFILTFNTMTTEAQHSLLKPLEEPTPGTHFFLLTRSAELLIPTVRSRLMVVFAGTIKNTDVHKDIVDFEYSTLSAKKFLSATKSERLMMLKDLIEAKDKVNTARFFNALLFVIHRKKDFHKDEKLVTALRYIEDNNQYVFDRSASLKMLLEHAALVIPQLEA